MVGEMLASDFPSMSHQQAFQHQYVSTTKHESVQVGGINHHYGGLRFCAVSSWVASEANTDLLRYPNGVAF